MKKAKLAQSAPGGATPEIPVEDIQRIHVTEVLDADSGPAANDGEAKAEHLPALVFDGIDPFEAALNYVVETIGIDRQYDMADKGEVALAKHHKSLLGNLRAAADEAYESWNRPYLTKRTENIAIRDYFKWAVGNIEGPINDQITAEAKRKKLEKEARDKAEQERVHAHRVALSELEGISQLYLSSSVEAIQEKITDLTRSDFLSSRDWEEYAERAAESLALVISAMGANLNNATSRETLAKLQADQKEAEERRQKEQARTDGLKTRIHEVELAPQTCFGMDSAFVQTQIDQLKLVDPFEFEEFAREANAAKTTALTTLEGMLTAAKQAEEQARQLADTRAEADRQAEELRQSNAKAAKSQEDARLAEEQRVRDAQDATDRQALHEAALSEIQGIQQQLAIATLGRAGVRAGGTIECIRETLAETERWTIAEDRFGGLTSIAQAAKDKAITEIRQLLTEAEAREAERLAKEQAEADALARVQDQATNLLASLLEVVAYAREAGHDWLCLVEAEALIAKVDPEGSAQ